MGEVRQATAGAPRCPNHKVPMLSTGGKKDHKGKTLFQCPISEVLFSVKHESGGQGVQYDVNGNAMNTYVIEGKE